MVFKIEIRRVEVMIGIVVWNIGLFYMFVVESDLNVLSGFRWDTGIGFFMTF